MRSDSLQSIYTIYMLPIGANRIYQWRIGCDAGANRLPAKDAIRGRREMIRRSFLLTAAAFSIAATAAQPAMAREQWSKEQANTWYDKQQWLIGANYTPGSAVNAIELRRAEERREGKEWGLNSSSRGSPET